MESTSESARTRLLIALAKVRLGAAEQEAATAHARRIDDWDAVIDTAARNFSLPGLRQHLATMDPEITPPEVRDRLAQSANASAVRNMLLLAAQRRFKEECLDPLDQEALFFKGINLAGQYYPDLGLRPCRDIDVLVPKGTLPRIVRKAISQGYRFVIPGQADTPLETAEAIEAALHYRTDASLLSPDGMAIDLQIKLDKYSGIFNGVDFFAEAVPMTLGGTTYLTMPPALLFNYVCHHHARHVWARLNWLSDLDAMVSAPGFDLDAVLALSSQLKQRGTVEASLELQRLMSPLASWEARPDTWRGLKFLDLCLRNLSGDVELEKRIGFNMIGGEFMYDWQVEPGLIRRARLWRWRHVLQPTIRQYTRFPLPRGLRWMYVLPRLIDVALRARDRSRKETD